MESGRALDAEVAEKVMGWRRIEWEGGTTPMGRKPENILSLVLDEVPHYSTDIAAAWMVVEHLINPDGPHGPQKWSFGMEYSSVVDWVVDFTPRARHPKAREYPAFQAQAGTAPKAICQAALACLHSDPE